MQLVSKISNLPVCDPDPPTLQTDGQTDRDGRHAIAIPRFALKCIARWKVNEKKLCYNYMHVRKSGPAAGPPTTALRYDQGCCDVLIGSRIRAFSWHQINDIGW